MPIGARGDRVLPGVVACTASRSAWMGISPGNLAARGISTYAAELAVAVPRAAFGSATCWPRERCRTCADAAVGAGGDPSRRVSCAGRSSRDPPRWGRVPPGPGAPGCETALPALGGPGCPPGADALDVSGAAAFPRRAQRLHHPRPDPAAASDADGHLAPPDDTAPQARCAVGRRTSSRCRRHPGRRSSGRWAGRRTG